jgi:hypothetical protein
MRLAKMVGLIVIGIVVGAFGNGAIQPAQAQRQTETRLEVSYTGQTLGTSNLTFVKDTKTGACWLAAFETRGSDSAPQRPVALATAPAESCQ